MKKVVCLFMVLSVIILLAGCKKPNNSPECTSPTDATKPTEASSPTQVDLSEDELVEIVAQQLDVPNDTAITSQNGETYYREAVGCDGMDIAFYEDGYMVAGACVDPTSGELLQDIYKYDSANMCFYRYFQDEYFARDVAESMNKAPHEAVTEEELASFAGTITTSGQVESLVGIGYLKSITELCVVKCIMKEVPNEILQCKNMKRLYISKVDGLRKLPEDIGDLQELEHIVVSLTQMERLPESIGELKKLKYLGASSTNITAVPESIGNCESLVILDLHSTDITEIPDSVTKLKNLKSLDLGYTKITALPENIGALKELVRLDLFGLDLRHLPQSAKNLTKLEYLNVYDNYNLDEEYKRWFENKCYECANDPQNSADWDDGI